MKSHAPKPQASEFDMRDFASWIHEHEKLIQQKLTWLKEKTSLPCPKLINGDLLELTSTEIANVLGRFSENARNRSILVHIKAMPPAWIAKNSTRRHQTICHLKSMAIHEDAFVVGAPDSIHRHQHKITQDILLFKVPQVSAHIEKYLQLHALIREYAHTIITPLEHGCHHEYVLSMSQNYHAEAHVFLGQFAQTVSKCSPISHASAAFWPLPGASHRLFCRYVGMELCESITAHLLGFVYCPDKERWFDPFHHRPRVKELVEDFLEASLIPEARI